MSVPLTISKYCSVTLPSAGGVAVTMKSGVFLFLTSEKQLKNGLNPMFKPQTVDKPIDTLSDVEKGR